MSVSKFATDQIVYSGYYHSPGPVPPHKIIEIRTKYEYLVEKQDGTREWRPEESLKASEGEVARPPVSKTK